MKIRALQREEIEKIRGIDRSEVIDYIYYFKKEELVLNKEHYDLHGWVPGELDKSLSHINEIYDRGGSLFGAFEGSGMIGVAVLDSKFIGSKRDQLQLYFLHVSRDFRNRGIGKELLNIAIQRAQKMGAKKLYISATPSKSTVNFYMNLGCTLTNEIDKELFELEPEDIHLELRIL